MCVMLLSASVVGTLLGAVRERSSIQDHPSFPPPYLGAIRFHDPAFHLNKILVRTTCSSFSSFSFSRFSFSRTADS